MKGFAVRASIPILIFSIWSYQTAMSLDVSGDVWGVWSPGDNPFRVVGELRVPPGSTLVIRPGCYIDFRGHYKFIVDSTATLSAVGTESDSITFTTADTATGWFGLRFYYADSNSGLSYCIIEHGKAAEEDDPFPPWPDMQGGGVNCVNSDISITHCLIRNNAARHGRGGGIFISESTALISDNTIHQNRAGFYGGGIHCSGCDVTISGNSITANIAWFPLGGDMGGGISCFGSDVNIIDNIIKYNTAGVSSGGIMIFGGSLAFIVNNIIEYNTAELSGGIGLRGPDTYMANNVIANNLAAYYNGGIVLNSPRITLLNNVVAFNEAQLQPGVRLIGEGVDSVVNNIIWGNMSPDGEQIIIDSDSAVVAFCNIQGGWEGEGNIDVEPLFRDPENDDFHLMSTDCGDPYDSPCIDAGHPDIIDVFMDCSWGLGTIISDMGAYGGGDSGMVAIEYDYSERPERFSLMQNYPNPFNASTTIEYSLPEAGQVRIYIYDLLGRKVETLVDEEKQAGQHQVTWDAKDRSSSIYFYRIQAGDYAETKKMVLLK